MGIPPDLSPAELERLAILSEEMGEVIQIIGKIIRHGYNSYNPRARGESAISNRASLERELGDVFAAIEMMGNATDVSIAAVHVRRLEKHARIRKYLHHQPKP